MFVRSPLGPSVRTGVVFSLDRFRLACVHTWDEQYKDTRGAGNVAVEVTRKHIQLHIHMTAA